MILQIAFACYMGLLVNATLNCEFQGPQQRDIVCTSGDSDNVLTQGVVSDHRRITGITLRGCRISDLELGSFDGLPALEYLDLSSNKIKNLTLGVFDGLKHLKVINLSHNQIPSFPLGLFDEMPELVIWDLKGNKLNNLELGIFDEVKQLKHVDLSSNAITGRDLNVYLFDQTPYITLLDFSRNDMSMTDENLLQAFQALDFLNLDRCFLTEVPAFALKENLKTMKHLLLSTNKIRKVENPTTFVNLENLEIINFVDNAIEYIADKAFSPLKKLKLIVMTNNRLKHIPESLFQFLPQLADLDLSYNIIETVPVNAFRGSPLRKLNLAANKFTYLSNNFCLELKNSGGQLREFYFNQNPWQCACLNDILSEVKRLGISYDGVKYNGNEPVCVTSHDFNCKRQPAVNDYFVDLYFNSISM